MVITTSILSVALVSFLASLGSSQSSNEFVTSRNRSLSELRVASAAFSREARQASEAVVSGVGTSVAGVTRYPTVTLSTYVNGALQSNVQWVAQSTAGLIELKRITSGGTRVFPTSLTTTSVFSYNPTLIDPATGVVVQLPELKLRMTTKPMVKFPPVLLEVEVSLRNVLA